MQQHTVVKIDPLWCHKEPHSLQRVTTGTRDKPASSSMQDLYVFLEQCSEQRLPFFSFPSLSLSLAACRGGPSITRSCSTKRGEPLHMYAVIYIGVSSAWDLRPIDLRGLPFKTTSAWGRQGSPVALVDVRAKKKRKRKKEDPDSEGLSTLSEERRPSASLKPFFS